MLQIGDRFGQGLACKVVGEGLGTFGGITKAPLGLWLRQAAALPESLRVRMRTERSPMRTLKKPPKDKTFLLKNGKKHRRKAGFRTSIAFEKKLPFLLQCKKVTLQEKCASDVI